MQKTLHLSDRAIINRLHHHIDNLRQLTGNWWSGIVFLCGDTCPVELEIYEVPAEYGIAGGRISKLWIGSPSQYHYERGLSKPPDCPETEEFVKKVVEALRLGDELSTCRQYL